MKTCVSKHEDGVVTIKVVPRAAKTAVEGCWGEAVKIRLKAPPVEGRANKALLEFLAKKLQTKVSCLEVVTGETARLKRIRVIGMTEEAVRKVLLADQGGLSDCHK